MKYIVIAFLSLICSAACLGNVDIGPGKTYTNIQAAWNAGAIKAGDTVFLHAGSFSGYQGISKLKGNESNWIVFTRYKNDAIDISGTWQFMSCEYIKFLNLNFKANAKNTGRLMSVDNSGSCATQSRKIVFDSCSFSDVTDANAITSFKFGGVDDFIVKNCTFKNMKVCNAFDFNSCHNGLISNNLIENCLSAGHIKGGASDITMERNLFINASASPWVAFELGGDTGAEFYCPNDKFEVKNLKFYSNIIVGGYRGLALSSATECIVANNTFYNCGQATLRFLTTSRLYPELNGNLVENNIFAFGSSAYINGGNQPSTAAFMTNNIYCSISDPDFNGAYWDTPALDPIKEVKPMIYGSKIKIFVDAPNGDFHLIEGSPAIGNASNFSSEPFTDFYGRPFKTKRSIGAIEYEGGVGIGEEISVDRNGIIIYPNPTSDYIYIDEKLAVNNSIIIYNFMGEKIKEYKAFESEKMQIDVSNLTNGIYILKVGNEVYKFIKE